MKNGIFLTIFLLMISLSNLVYAREGDCVYSLGNGLNIYCSFVTAADNTKRYLEVIYPPQMAITSCVDNTMLPFSFSKEMVGKDNLVPLGTHTVSFYQCINASCDQKKSVGVSTFNVTADGTVKPNKFNITLDSTFGDNCVPSKVDPKNIAIIATKADCNKTPYCININLPNNMYKFIKVISEDATALTYCMNKNNVITLSNQTTAGAHTYSIYQCDTLTCDHQKLLAKEVLSVSADGKFDHSKDNITPDPNFGNNCAVVTP